MKSDSDDGPRRLHDRWCPHFGLRSPKTKNKKNIQTQDVETKKLMDRNSPETKQTDPANLHMQYGSDLSSKFVEGKIPQLPAGGICKTNQVSHESMEPHMFDSTKSLVMSENMVP